MSIYGCAKRLAKINLLYDRYREVLEIRRKLKKKKKIKKERKEIRKMGTS